MRSAHWMVAAAFGVSAAGSAWALGDGLMPSESGTWPRWHGRLSVGTYSSTPHLDAMNADHQGLKVGGASLMGDYYFVRQYRGVGSASGFRATSGVLFGSRAPSLLAGTQSADFGSRSFSINRRMVSVWGLALATDSDPVPYVGLGYTGLAGKGAWGFSADLGLMALSPGSAVKLGRVFTGQSLDETLRDMRLSPMLQLGVSYSF